MTGVDSSPEFIARDAEMGLLDDALARAYAGEPGIVVVGGEAGVGKTRLLDEWAARNRGRALVVIGRCFPSSRRGLPYGAFADLYRDLARQVSDRELDRILGPARDELRLLVPEFDTGRPAPPRDIVEGALASRARFFQLLLGIAERLQETGPAVIAIDDLQWADGATLDLVGFLARGVREGRLLFVVVVRTEDLPVGDPVLTALGHLEQTGRVRRIEVARFTRTELAAQVTAILGGVPDAGLVDRVLTLSDGNPFFAEELVASIRRGEGSDVPPMLDDLLRARLAAVDAPTRAVLRVAAVGGMEIDDELVASAADLPPDAVAGALREAAEHGLIVRPDRTPGRPVFRHRLLQEQISRDLLPGERRHLNAAYAEALERSPTARVVAGETARHWLLADRPDRALPALLAAGLEAERRFAFADARRHLEEALRLTQVVAPSDDRELDVVGVLQHAAEDAMLGGDAPGAVALARRALDALGTGGDPRREAAIHERLRWYLWESGDRDGAERALDQAYQLVPADPPSAIRARVLGQIAGVRLRQGRFEGSLALASEAVDVARATGALPELAFALGVKGYGEAALGRADEGLGDLREALGMAEFLERPEGRALGISNLASMQLYVGRPDDASRTALEGLETVRSLGLERMYGGSLAATAAAAAYRLGRWEEARTFAARAAASAPPGPEGAWAGAVAMRLAAGSGDHELMASGRAACEPFLPAVTDRVHAEWYQVAVIEAELWADRVDRAVEVASGAIRALPPAILDEPVAWTFALALRAAADRAEAARMTRDGEVAEASAAMARDALDAWHARRASVGDALPDPAVVVATDDLCAAEAERAAGRDSPALWASAAHAFDAAAIVHVSAYARYRQAGALLAAGVGSTATVRARRAAAEAPLTRALEAAERLGARPLAAAASLLAGRARVEVHPAATPAPTGGASAVAPSAGDRGIDQAAAFIADHHLTGRELEVLALVGSGWSNGEIADALFITRKTASVHVSNVLGKLGVADRIEAASLAQRAGLEGPPRPGSVLDELDHGS